MAREHAACGWHVFPLAIGGKLPIFHHRDRCRGRGACRDGHLGWQERATRDDAQIARWWAGTAPHNVGIACGPSGLLVVDLDIHLDAVVAGPDGTDGADGAAGTGDPAWPARAAGPARDGAAELARLAADHGQKLPSTFSVTTPSGGLHHYFHAPPDLDLTISQGRLGPGIDTRGRGGLVVAPGSVRPDGVYRVTRPGPVAELPLWLAELLVVPQAEPLPTPDRARALSEARVRAYLDKVIDIRAAEVRDAPLGSRQWTLKVAARRLGQFVGGGDLDETEAYRALYDATRGHLGVEEMDHREVDATIRGGMAYGRRAPIQLGGTLTSSR